MSNKKYEVIEEIAKLSENKKWNLEINLIRWSGNETKYDFRTFNDDKTKIGKGIALTKNEMNKLRDILNNIDLENNA
ncbi:MAG: PC4/YdbC family ssDNA-binding protein [Bacillota bacterium]|nr:PC4/YdbC family ssDNA-binding protein [Bacillota bacterium]